MRQRKLQGVEKGETDQAGEASVPSLDEESSGAGRVAVSEVRVAERPSSSSPDPAEPTGARCTREPCHPLCLLPHGGARAASLFRPGGQSVQQATTTQEVKIRPAVISGADNLRSPANCDGRALEVGAQWNPRSGAKRVVRGDRTLIWVASGEAAAGSDVDLLVDAEEGPNLLN
jgi:hypothetical protein